jgi:hypothetical protein
MHLHLRVAVFERIRRALGFEWQLALFPNRNKADTKRVGDRRAEEKTARINSHHFVDRQIAAAAEKDFDRFVKKSRIDQDGSDILEDNSALREIWYVTNSGRRRSIMVSAIAAG